MGGFKGVSLFCEWGTEEPVGSNRLSITTKMCTFEAEARVISWHGTQEHSVLQPLKQKESGKM